MRRQPHRSRGLVPTADVSIATTAPRPAPYVPTVEQAARHRETSEGARPRNSRIAYEGDIAHFDAWCAGHGYPSFPAAPSAVMYYLTDLSYGVGPRSEHKGRQPRARGGWSFATIQRHAGSIGKKHRMAKVADPTRDEHVIETLANIRRRIGKMQRQARPLLPEHLRAAFDAMPAPRSTRDVRDVALATLAFACAGRRSEVSALDLADVEFTRDGALVNVGPSAAQPERRTKANQDGAREIINVLAGEDPVTDPITTLRAWLALRGTDDGPLFYGVTRQDKIRRKRMRASEVSRMAKRVAVLAGLDQKHYSAHSLRAGFVTAADAAGVPSTAIMRQTRHKLVDTLKRYIRPEDGFKNHPGKGLL